ncbi:MAG: IS3 family transposase [Actinomycetia bacterium]|nr:IS3 family transposase [Actinomycetes bacterium]
MKRMSERLACKPVGLARSTYRRAPLAATPADPGAELRQWLRDYSIKHPCHGFRRAWTALRYDEHQQVNMKKVHRLWKDEGLQRPVRSPRKRAGESSWPAQVDADAPKVVWALDSGPSPASASWTNSRCASPRPGARRWCCAWTTV